MPDNAARIRHGLSHFRSLFHTRDLHRGHCTGRPSIRGNQLAPQRLQLNLFIFIPLAYHSLLMLSSLLRAFS